MTDDTHPNNPLQARRRHFDKTSEARAVELLQEIESIEESLPDETGEHLAALYCELESVGVETTEAPSQVPSQRLRHRFYRFLDDELSRHSGRQTRRRTAGLFAWLFHPPRQAAWVAVAMLLCVGLGTILGSGLERRGVDSLRQEVDQLQRLAVLSLLEHPSASERLEGVSLSATTANHDDVVLTALLETMRHDPSENVRLAAIETLGQMTERPMVESGLVEALPGQSPLLQVSIGELLARSQSPSTRQALEQVLSSPETDSLVRSVLHERLGSF